LVEALPDLAAEAPADATLVVFHSAVLAYLTSEARSQFIELVGGLSEHWISNEGQGVVAALPVSARAQVDDGRFILAVDGCPRTLTDPHGRSLSGISVA